MEEFGTLNWSILIIYIFANLVMGFFLSQKIHSAEDFYVGQKNIPWWAIGVSVIASYVSALSFLGVPAWSYVDGMSVLINFVAFPLAIVLAITLFIPFFYNSGCASIYEYQEQRFGSKSRSAISAVFLITNALSAAAILYASALVLTFITGVDIIIAIIIITLVALIYTVMGGMAAVIWTDTIQGIVLFGGAVIILYAVLTEMPGSLETSFSALKDKGLTNTLNWDLDATNATTVWAGLIAMSLFYTTLFGVNQALAQRTLAAKNIGDAKKAYLVIGFAAPILYFVFTFLGIMLNGYYEGREFENGNTIILQFAADYGLPGLLGIIAAAVMAASMSTLDSSLNSMSTVTTIDFYQKYFRKDKSSAHYLKVSRFFTLVWASVITLPAIWFSQSSGSIMEVILEMSSYFIGSQLAMYGLGFFSKHTTEKGLLVGFVAGFVVVWILAATTDVAWPWFCLIGAVGNIFVSVPISILLDGKQNEWHPHSVPGQIAKYRIKNLPVKDGNWYVVPGKIDGISYGLLGFFVVFMFCLYLFDAMI